MKQCLNESCLLCGGLTRQSLQGDCDDLGSTKPGLAFLSELYGSEVSIVKLQDPVDVLRLKFGSESTPEQHGGLLCRLRHSEKALHL